MDISVKMKPIGTLKSVFHYKNGTPRQSSLCQAARGVLTIEKSVFNNPEHSLQGLEEFSHAWIIFVFHKNNNTYSKAKVRPPRLDGQKVGVFSTRSPYRPNNIGLSLVKIDKIDGASIHLSGIDLLDGTPVLDIKPYIPDYDRPRDVILDSVKLTSDETNELNEQSKECLDKTDEQCHSNETDQTTVLDTTDIESRISVWEIEEKIAIRDPIRDNIQLVTEGFYQLSEALKKVGEKLESSQSSRTEDGDCSQMLECMDLSQVCDTSQNSSENFSHIETEVESENINSSHGSLSLSKKLNIEKLFSFDSDATLKAKDAVSSSRGENSMHPEIKNTAVAPWLTNPPVSKLKVLFTQRALKQLHRFSRTSVDEDYRLQMLMNASEAEKSIAEILVEEPRSVYRRQHCPDNLYYFTLDVLHVTCWFDDDQVEVVRIKPVTLVPKLMQGFNKS